MSDPAPATETATLFERMMKHRAPVGDLVGFEVREAGNGRTVVTLQSGPRHFNPMGTLHGGILCDIADTAMGVAFASTLAPGESFTTVELKINYLGRCARQSFGPKDVWSSADAPSDMSSAKSPTKTANL